METLTTTQLAEIVSTSTNASEIREAWETAVELFIAGTHESDEELTIALVEFSSNPHTPESVIEDFWKNSDLRLLVDGVWQEFCEALLELPETPEDIREEIEQEAL